MLLSVLTTYRTRLFAREARLVRCFQVLLAERETTELCGADRLCGVVKWFNVKKQFGFITRSDTREDVFVCGRSIIAPNPEHFTTSLDPGEPVMFNVEQTVGGPEAVDVTGPDGYPVRGQARARYRPEIFYRPQMIAEGRNPREVNEELKHMRLLRQIQRNKKGS